MHHYVYQILSLSPNEEGVLKIYSGLRSCECEPEEDTEYMGSGVLIRRAIEKYGRDKFMKLIIAKFDNREAAHECETQWLAKQFKFHGSDWMKFNKFHYNLRLNENSRDGFACSPETRAKQSAANIGKQFSEETKRKIGKVHAGKQLSDETKKKLSESHTGKQFSDEHKKKLSESRIGKQFSDETKKKMSEAKIGKQLSDETKKKMSEARIGKQFSDEHKKKMSEVRIGEKCYNFKGLTIGINRETKTIVFCGNADMKARGFHSGHISAVILEKKPHHKGFTFIRTDDPDQLRELLRTATFYDDVSRQRIEEFIQE